MSEYDVNTRRLWSTTRQYFSYKWESGSVLDKWTNFKLKQSGRLLDYDVNTRGWWSTRQYDFKKSDGLCWTLNYKVQY